MTKQAIPPPRNPESDGSELRLAKQRHRTAIDFYVATILGAAFLYGCAHPKALPDGVMWALLTSLAAIGGVGRYLNARGRGDMSAVLCIVSSAKHAAVVVGAALTRHGGPWMAIALAVGISVSSCATLGKVIRTVDVVARDLCEIWGAEQGEAKLGMSPAEFCAVDDNVRPFVDAALAAKHAGGVEAGARLAR
jgi:hypothetical protein